MPFAYLLVAAAFRNFDSSLEEASQTLRASRWTTFHTVTLPLLRPGLANAFLLPHMGSATVETRNAMGFKALDNLDAFFAGRPLVDPIA